MQKREEYYDKIILEEEKELEDLEGFLWEFWNQCIGNRNALASSFSDMIHTFMENYLQQEYKSDNNPKCKYKLFLKGSNLLLKKRDLLEKYEASFDYIKGEDEVKVSYDFYKNYTINSAYSSDEKPEFTMRLLLEPKKQVIEGDDNKILISFSSKGSKIEIFVMKSYLERFVYSVENYNIAGLEASSRAIPIYCNLPGYDKPYDLDMMFKDILSLRFDRIINASDELILGSNNLKK